MAGYDDWLRKRIGGAMNPYNRGVSLPPAPPAAAPGMNPIEQLAAILTASGIPAPPPPQQQSPQQVISSLFGAGGSAPTPPPAQQQSPDQIISSMFGAGRSAPPVQQPPQSGAFQPGPEFLAGAMEPSSRAVEDLPPQAIEGLVLAAQQKARIRREQGLAPDADVPSQGGALFNPMSEAMQATGNAIMNPWQTTKDVVVAGLTAAGWSQQQVVLKMADNMGKMSLDGSINVPTPGDFVVPTGIGPGGGVKVNTPVSWVYDQIPGAPDFIDWAEDHPDVVKEAYTEGWQVGDNKVKPGKEAVLAAFYDSKGGGISGFLKAMVFDTLTDPTMLIPVVTAGGRAVRTAGRGIEEAARARQAQRAAEAASVVRRGAGAGERAITAADASAAAAGKAVQGVGRGIELAAQAPDALGRGLGAAARGVVEVAEAIPVAGRPVRWAVTESAKSKQATLEGIRRAQLALLAKSDAAKDFLDRAIPGRPTPRDPLAGTGIDAPIPGQPSGGVIGPDYTPVTVFGTGDEVGRIGDFRVVTDGDRFAVLGPDGRAATGYFDTEADALAEAARLSGLPAEGPMAEIDAILGGEVEPTNNQVTDAIAAVDIATEPPIPNGMTRLYRGEPIPDPARAEKAPAWLRANPKDKARRLAQGRWFSDDRDLAIDYIYANSEEWGLPGRLVYVDVPTSDVANYNVARSAPEPAIDPETGRPIIDGDTGEPLTIDPIKYVAGRGTDDQTAAREFFLPPDLADTKQPVGREGWERPDGAPAEVLERTVPNPEAEARVRASNQAIRDRLRGEPAAEPTPLSSPMDLDEIARTPGHKDLIVERADGTTFVVQEREVLNQGGYRVVSRINPDDTDRGILAILDDQGTVIDAAQYTDRDSARLVGERMSRQINDLLGAESPSRPDLRVVGTEPPSNVVPFPKTEPPITDALGNPIVPIRGTAEIAAEATSGPTLDIAEWASGAVRRVPGIPGPKKGTTRLYRVEPPEGRAGSAPVDEAEAQFAGRWFTDKPHHRFEKDGETLAQYYLDKTPDGQVVYIDVPTDQVEQWRVRNHSGKPGIGGEDPKFYSIDWDNEFFIPSEIAAGKKTYIPATEPDTIPAESVGVPPPGDEEIMFRDMQQRELGSQVLWESDDGTSRVVRVPTLVMKADETGGAIGADFSRGEFRFERATGDPDRPWDTIHRETYDSADQARTAARAIDERINQSTGATPFLRVVGDQPDNLVAFPEGGRTPDGEDPFGAPPPEEMGGSPRPETDPFAQFDADEDLVRTRLEEALRTGRPIAGPRADVRVGRPSRRGEPDKTVSLGPKPDGQNPRDLASFERAAKDPDAAQRFWDIYEPKLRNTGRLLNKFDADTFNRGVTKSLDPNVNLARENHRKVRVIVNDYVDQVDAWRQAGVPGDPPPYRRMFDDPETPHPDGLDRRFIRAERDAKGTITNRQAIWDAWLTSPTNRPDIRNLYEVAVTTTDHQLATDIRYAMRNSKWGQYRAIADEARDERARLFGDGSILHTKDRVAIDEADAASAPKPSSIKPPDPTAPPWLGGEQGAAPPGDWPGQPGRNEKGQHNKFNKTWELAKEKSTRAQADKVWEREITRLKDRGSSATILRQAQASREAFLDAFDNQVASALPPSMEPPLPGDELADQAGAPIREPDTLGQGTDIPTEDWFSLQEGEAAPAPPAAPLPEEPLGPGTDIPTEDWFKVQDSVAGVRLPPRSSVMDIARRQGDIGGDESLATLAPTAPRAGSPSYVPKEVRGDWKWGQASPKDVMSRAAKSGSGTIEMSLDDVYRDSPDTAVLFERPLANAEVPDDRRLGDIFLDLAHAKVTAGMKREDAVREAIEEALELVAPKRTTPAWQRTKWGQLLSTVGKAYMAVGRYAKGTQMYSWTNVPRRFVGDLTGNTWGLITNGKGEAALEQFNLRSDGFAQDSWRRLDESWAEGMADSKFGRLLEATGEVDLNPELDVAILKGREEVDRALAKNDPTAGWFRKGARSVGAVTGFGASDIAKRSVSVIDRTGRSSLEFTEFIKGLTPTKQRFLDDIALNNPDLAAGLDNLGDTFSPKDVRRLAEEFGHSKGQAEHLARQWRGEVTKIRKAAKDEVNRILFDYKTNNLDEILNKGFFYHYWVSRATPLYLQTAIRNPAVMASYAHMTDAMQRDCERRGGEKCGYLKMFETAGGLAGYFNPLFLLSTTLINFEPEFNNPDGRMIDRVLDKVPAMLNPMLQGAISAIGLSGEDYLDPIASHGPRRVWSTGLNIAKSQGWFGTEKSRFIDPTPEFWNKLVAASSEYLEGKTLTPWAKKVKERKPGISDGMIMAHLAVESIYARHGIEPGTDPMWLPNEVQDEIVAAITAIDLQQEETNPDAQQAFQDWQSGNWKRALGSMAFSGVGLGDPDLDRLRTIRRDDVGTPKEIAAAENTLDYVEIGGPLDAALTQQEARYQKAGPPMGRYYNLMHNRIHYSPEEVPSSIAVAGKLYKRDELIAMSEDERKIIADEWLLDQGMGPGERQAYFDARDALSADPNNAEYAAYLEWSSGARDIGMEKLMKISPRYKQYINDLPKDVRNDPARLQQFAFSEDAYQFTEGERPSAYSDEPTEDAVDISQVNPVDLLKGTAGTTPEKAAGKKDPGLQFREDLVRYHTDLALFEQQLQAFTGNPNARWQEGMNPQLESAMRWHLANAGIDIPSKPASLVNYEAWAHAQRYSGRSDSVADYIEWARESQRQLGNAGLDLDDLMAMAIYGKSALSIDTPVPQSPSPVYAP